VRGTRRLGPVRVGQVLGADCLVGWFAGSDELPRRQDEAEAAGGASSGSAPASALATAAATAAAVAAFSETRVRDDGTTHDALPLDVPPARVLHMPAASVEVGPAGMTVRAIPHEVVLNLLVSDPALGLRFLRSLARQTTEQWHQTDAMVSAQ